MGAKVGVVGKRHQGCPVSPREPGPSGAPTDQEARVPHLVCVIGKVDLVENLGGFVLDGLHLHQVRGVLPGPVSENQGSGGGRKGGKSGDSRFLGPWGAESRGHFGDRQTQA